MPFFMEKKDYTWCTQSWKSMQTIKFRAKLLMYSIEDKEKEFSLSTESQGIWFRMERGVLHTTLIETLLSEHLEVVELSLREN